MTFASLSAWQQRLCSGHLLTPQQSLPGEHPSPGPESKRSKGVAQSQGFDVLPMLQTIAHTSGMVGMQCMKSLMLGYLRLGKELKDNSHQRNGDCLIQASKLVMEGLTVVVVVQVSPPEITHADALAKLW